MLPIKRQIHRRRHIPEGNESLHEQNHPTRDVQPYREQKKRQHSNFQSSQKRVVQMLSGFPILVSPKRAEECQYKG